MSEFKEFERGDWVVFDTSKPYCRLLPPCLMKFIQVEDGDAVVESQGRWCLVSLAALKPASEYDIEAGHRIAMPSLPEPIGSLQELHPEFAKVLHENFLELLGDDFPIENHISPNCQSRDV
ncbi:hypothetical protein [Acinetobacter sp. 8_A20231192]|uniref:hypothetical protein n=1 Tax=Acinetobacter sp. 8_A20231192 TaxID=3141545 RepID=UPI00320B60B1